MSYASRPPSPITTMRVAPFATVALAGVTYFTVAIVALHFLARDVDPVRYTTSFYAVGPYAILMSSAFLAMSIATTGLVVGLAKAARSTARSRVALALLGVWAVGALIAMLFPIGPEGAAPNLANTVHRINGPLAFLALSLGALLTSVGFVHDEWWRPIRRAAIALSLIMVAGFVGLAVSLATGGAYSGLLQRILLTAVVAWYVLTALRLRSSGPRRGEQLVT